MFTWKAIFLGGFTTYEDAHAVFAAYSHECQFRDISFEDNLNWKIHSFYFRMVIFKGWG